jgi:hypothetical protein
LIGRCREYFKGGRTATNAFAKVAPAVITRSASDYIPTPFATSSNEVWAEDLADSIDSLVAELGQDREVITVATTPLTGDRGGMLGVMVTVVWREP